MKLTLQQLEEKIKELRAEMDALEPARARYYELSTKAHELNKEMTARKYASNLSAAIFKCSYQEPEYPRMGESGRNGSVFFKTKEDAEELITLLQRGYTYGYRLNWSVPGLYVVEPDWKYDHDGDVIYTATFTKDNESQIMQDFEDFVEASETTTLKGSDNT